LEPARPVAIEAPEASSSQCWDHLLCPDATRALVRLDRWISAARRPQRLRVPRRGWSTWRL